MKSHGVMKGFNKLENLTQYQQRIHRDIVTCMKLSYNIPLSI
jgi:hypothetical protein